jgi:dephospho-CoA kinase
MKRSYVIAIVGMTNSGKGEVANQLSLAGYPIVHFGKMVYEEIKKRGLNIEKDEKSVNKDMRDKEGPLVLAKRVVAKAKAYLNKGHEVVVLDGLYSWSEFKYCHEQFGEDLVVVAVVVDKKLRYERALKRKDAQRKYNLEQVIARDIHEIENLEKGGPIAYADYYIFNNKGMDDLTQRVNELITQLNL